LSAQFVDATHQCAISGLSRRVPDAKRDTRCGDGVKGIQGKRPQQFAQSAPVLSGDEAPESAIVRR